jgi:pyruvate dehydrogenase E2 component (dihydrolipoamide acetyltransferase)
MSREFRMPSLGADMQAGTLVEWRIQKGSRVRRGDVVALVDTEKGIIDIESFEDGVVETLSVQPGVRVPVGTTLALFEGEPAAPTTAPPLAPAPVAAAAPVLPSAAVPKAVPERTRRVSPAARTRAASLGIDLALIRGTGPEGVVTLADVERAGTTTGAPMPTPAATGRAGIRGAIAASMGRGKREIPHYYLQLAMDFHAAASWLEEFNRSRPVPERLLPAVLLIKATARAAAEKSGFNGFYGAAGFEPSASVHVGMAIALRGGGLVAPAILDADRKPLPTIMRELQDLVGRVRSGHMRSSEIGTATLTITSLGDEGVDLLYPIIYPPQVAIVGFGSVLERPWVVDGRIEVRRVLNLTLAADHRVTDGRQGAQFLARVRDWLARPADL